MRPSTFSLLAALVAERTGIVILPEKQYLLETRLRPLVHLHGFASLDALAGALARDPDPDLVDDVADAMTTNETSFFRDTRPFEVLDDRVLPELVEKRRSTRTLRVWSAACSSGQEIYSIAMLLAERFPELDGWRREFLATDVSPTMTERCEEATYSRQEVARGLDDERIERHFFEAGPNELLLDPSLKRGVMVLQHNLLEPLPPLGPETDGSTANARAPRVPARPPSAGPDGAAHAHQPAQMTGPFDLIVLRNVLIYFDAQVRRTVMERIHERLAPDGVLMLGTAESADEELFERADRSLSGFFRPLPRADRRRSA
ncbi:MAG: protein-glutamate O-methyltransferase CheR [Planctomycetota bacterium]